MKLKIGSVIVMISLSLGCSTAPKEKNGTRFRVESSTDSTSSTGTNSDRTNVDFHAVSLD